MNENPILKVLRVAKEALSWMLVVLAVFMMIFTVVSVSVCDQNDCDIFGFKAFIVTSDSMKATDFAAGDIIFCREVDPETLEVGDIITFQSQDPASYGEVVTHKIREIKTTTKENLWFVTYGTTTGVDDEYPVLSTFILGKYEAHIPFAGRFFNFLRTPLGYGLCIFLPFVLLIAVQGANCFGLFRRYKEEENAAENAERERERQEQERMKKELESLRAQLAAQKGGEENETTGNTADTK